MREDVSIWLNSSTWQYAEEVISLRWPARWWLDLRPECLVETGTAQIAADNVASIPAFLSWKGPQYRLMCPVFREMDLVRIAVYGTLRVGNDWD